MRQVGGTFVRSDINIRPRMASHDISWVSGAHVRFGDLDFIITMGGELALAHAAIQPLPSIGLYCRRVEHQLSVSLALVPPHLLLHQ